MTCVSGTEVRDVRNGLFGEGHTAGRGGDAFHCRFSVRLSLSRKRVRRHFATRTRVSRIVSLDTRITGWCFFFAKFVSFYSVKTSGQVHRPGIDPNHFHARFRGQRHGVWPRFFVQRVAADEDISHRNSAAYLKPLDGFENQFLVDRT